MPVVCLKVLTNVCAPGSRRATSVRSLATHPKVRFEEPQLINVCLPSQASPLFVTMPKSSSSAGVNVIRMYAVSFSKGPNNS